MSKYRCIWNCFPARCKNSCRSIIDNCLGTCNANFSLNGELRSLCKRDCYRTTKTRSLPCLRSCNVRGPTPSPT